VWFINFTGYVASEYGVVTKEELSKK
jgi:hypothetical protein